MLAVRIGFEQDVGASYLEVRTAQLIGDHLENGAERLEFWATGSRV